MTLFSSCGELGKPNLLYRPGRASGDITKKGHMRIDTPLAQVQGSHEFEFALIFAEHDDAVLYDYLHRFETPSVFYQNQKINLFYERIDNKIQFTENEETLLPKENSYLQIDGNILVSSIYNSVIDGSMQLRFQSFKDITKDEISSTFDFEVGNLLKQGKETTLKADRLYTLRGKKNEYK